MKNKFLSIFLSFVLLFQPTNIFSQPIETTTSTIGKFMILKQGQPSKFGGVLLDGLAIATIITDKEQNEKSFNLRLKYELDKQASDLNFKVNELKTNIDYQQKTDNEIIKQKDNQIKNLTEISLNKNDNMLLYLCISFISGIFIALGAVYVGHQTTK